MIETPSPTYGTAMFRFQGVPGYGIFVVQRIWTVTRGCRSLGKLADDVAEGIAQGVSFGQLPRSTRVLASSVRQAVSPPIAPEVGDGRVSRLASGIWHLTSGALTNHPTVAACE